MLNRTALVLLTAAPILGLGSASFADIFASFTQNPTTTNALTAANDAGAGAEIYSGANSPATIPVTFEFTTSANTYNGSTAPIPATLTLFSIDSITSPATTVGGKIFQPYDTILLQFTADTPVDGNTVLLQATLSGAFLQATTTQKVASLLDSAIPDSLFGPGDVAYYSDFLTFATSDADNASDIEFTGLSAFPIAGAGGYLASFTAFGTGTFTATLSSGGPTVPEPASLALLAFAGLPLLARRRRAKLA